MIPSSPRLLLLAAGAPLAVLAVLWATGCSVERPIVTISDPPDISPVSSPDTTSTPPPALALEETRRLDIAPILRDTLTIDLPAVLRAALAEDIDILQARLEVDAAQGRAESAKAQWMPALNFVPALFELVSGSVRATPGNLTGVDFNTLRSFIGAELIINPGRAHYESLAARKRLLQAAHQEQAVLLSTLHDAAFEFYSLLLAQTEVLVARQSLLEARELVRITRARVEQGLGVEADRLRALAREAERTQGLITAVSGYHRVSVRLATALRLDPTLTLIPHTPDGPEPATVTLVRDDIEIPELLELAARYRPDLAGFRDRIEIVAAERSALAWGGFGPTFAGAYQVGGISGNTDDPDEHFGTRVQQRLQLGLGWRLRLSTLGDLKAVKAVEEQTRLEAQRMLDRVRAQVVLAAVGARAFNELVAHSAQEIDSAQAALRLTRSGLEAGTATTLDVLQSESSLAEARLRRARAVIGYNQSQVDLLASVGLLSDRTLLPRPRPD